MFVFVNDRESSVVPRSFLFRPVSLGRVETNVDDVARRDLAAYVLTRSTVDPDTSAIDQSASLAVRRFGHPANERVDAALCLIRRGVGQGLNRHEGLFSQLVGKFGCAVNRLNRFANADARNTDGSGLFVGVKVVTGQALDIAVEDQTD